MRNPEQISDHQRLLERFQHVRRGTLGLCEPLQLEDFVVQSADFVSPPKWHLGHTTWFFEEFVLRCHNPGYVPYAESYRHIFNSYYESVGTKLARPRRGQLSRPVLDEVLTYRKHVDDAVLALLQSENASSTALTLIELGLNHEEQHQELLLMDIKHIMYSNPLQPSLQMQLMPNDVGQARGTWIPVAEGLQQIGADNNGFCFDNELPRHRVFTEAFEIAEYPVTNAAFLEFIDDDGYGNPLLWLSDGWDWVRENAVNAPLYWKKEASGEWRVFSFAGWQPVTPMQPVGHVSYYEAQAFAMWSGARLPTETEWEVAAGSLKNVGAHWEWTTSAYSPYPGYIPSRNALGEYNGKFMVNQQVLRGGAYATPKDHARTTYRNFYQPSMRWQFAGFRLAKV